MPLVASDVDSAVRLLARIQVRRPSAPDPRRRRDRSLDALLRGEVVTVVLPGGDPARAASGVR